MIHWKTSTGEPIPNSGQPWREPVPGTGQELLPERRGRGDRTWAVSKLILQFPILKLWGTAEPNPAVDKSIPL
uniref:Uncharacterized protein n=1 Tax=Zonotrichia albicollis TaxID=44394 RepID=A0A8D2MC46_ZONAL